MWSPAPGRVEAANLTRFLERVAAGSGFSEPRRPPLGVAAALHAWSVREPAAFWPAVWDFCGVVATAPPTQIVDDAHRMPGARWFTGARLNFAENLLTDRSAGLRRPEAIVSWNEHGPVASVGWPELCDQVHGFAAGLRRAGVRPGDRVAGLLPNVIEAVVAMLATSSLGAVWTSCSPDFGVDGVLDRFRQVEPKVLVCARGALWTGSWIDSFERVRAIAARLPSLVAVVVADYGIEAGGSDESVDARAVRWSDFVEPAGSDARTFAQLPFNHPLYVLYSSGTTGTPKCIVHGQGGTLVQHLKEIALHCDVKPGDALFYYTTCGWMMWNWMVSSLALGATVVLYDGSPFPAAETRLWDLVEQQAITHFGTSAKYLSTAQKRGLRPAATHDLASLRTILSTGSPLLPESFDWVYAEVKSDLHLASISGGTDLVSCFVLGDPTAPVWRGEIQTAGLGMRVEVWGEDCQPLPSGQEGELVCTQAFPSMPVCFWNDPGDAKYRAAYFEHTARMAWRHGDWIERTERGGFVIHGRSDATLNPSGVRIGTAEIYRLVERLDEVVDSVVVGQERDGDERIVLFVVLREGLSLDESLRARIRREIREGASPRHVPHVITAVPEVPRTISGKVSELAVRRTLHGLAVENLEALANPGSLVFFRDFVAPAE